MDSKNSKISDLHRLLLNLSDKIEDKRKVTNMLLYQILAYTTHGQILKSHRKTINLKYQLHRVKKNLNYQIDHNLSQIFKIILSIS